MNERIRELCKHAGFIGEGFQNTVIGTCQETALENLADLIVRECCDKFVDMQHKFHPSICAYEIKKHFGVEE